MPHVGLVSKEIPTFDKHTDILGSDQDSAYGQLAMFVHDPSLVNCKRALYFTVPLKWSTKKYDVLQTRM